MKNQEMMVERYKGLLVCSHLIGFRQKCLSLHPKLNEVIKPVFNLIKVEENRYFQNVFARILANQLMPALQMANKTK